MSLRRRIFLWWALVLSGLWVFPNCPSGGVLKGDLSSAGFPWAFASWRAGRLEVFDLTAFASDALLGAAVVIAAAWACAWSRRAKEPSQ
jgi:hypothetical protein